MRAAYHIFGFLASLPPSLLPIVQHLETLGFLGYIFAMFWAILVSLIILGLAYLLQKAEPIIEFRNILFIIVGIFLVLYIAAAIFVSYKIKGYTAQVEQSTGLNTGSSTYIYEEPVNPTDLSTNP